MVAVAFTEPLRLGGQAEQLGHLQALGFSNVREEPVSTLRRVDYFQAHTYSQRNATMGSTLAARLAGTYVARNAAPRRTRETAHHVIGSDGSTPNSKLERKRLNHEAATNPSRTDTSR
jgi:hypothetical protein